MAAVETHCWYVTDVSRGSVSLVGEAETNANGGAVASTGAAVGIWAAVGVLVGSAVASGKGSTGAAVGVTTGVIVGDVVTRGTSVGVCCRGAKPQISLPPITSTDVISAHCRAFCEGYPEFANVLPATNSN